LSSLHPTIKVESKITGDEKICPCTEVEMINFPFSESNKYIIPEELHKQMKVLKEVSTVQGEEYMRFSV